MRNYNHELIEIHYTLIEVFLINFQKEILDISYSINGREIYVQVVLLENFILQAETKEKLYQKLVGFDIVLKDLYITKEMFNESKGDWLPIHYNWLEYLLFSKSEIL
jgi:hypothetical protein